MTPSDFSCLHILALKLSKKASDADIRSLVMDPLYSSVSSFAELRDYLGFEQHNDLYPEEKFVNEALIVAEKSSRESIFIIPINSIYYPKYLRAIDDAPAILHIKGNLDCLNKLPGVSVVGTRQITDNGSKIAYRISNFLASNGWVVVSGLALGVDTVAHTGALDSGQPCSTIAVLAHGLEKAKPAANKDLAQKILDNGGLWVSEHHIGTPPQPSQFVARNRIQLGLSVGSVIIEADLKSGSVTQARFCQKQRRPLFAVVPEDQSNRLGLLSAGTEMMVSDMGAYAIKSRNDYPNMLERFRTQYQLMTTI
jgi:DNA processing protein